MLNNSAFKTFNSESIKTANALIMSNQVYSSVGFCNAAIRTELAPAGIVNSLLFGQ